MNSRECSRVKIEVVGKGVFYACRGDNLGILLASKGIMPLPCGGNGLCGLCRVRVEGEVSPPTGNEVLRGLSGGERLACQVRVLGDVRVYAPTIRPPKISIYSLNIDLRSIKPVVKPIRLSNKLLPLRRGLPILPGEAHIGGLNVLRFLDTYYLTSPGETDKALIIDLGTTKIAYQNIDLNGRIIDEGYVFNPLNVYGSDIVSRMTIILDNPDKLGEMMDRLRREIIGLAERYRAGIVFIAGNSVMEHLYMGLPVDRLAEKPYQPLFSGPFITYTGRTPTILMPLISGYVGGDAYSELLASIYMDLEKPYLIIDLGTNTEVILVKDLEEIYATSAPAGPAFEGYISKGSGVVMGGIYRVWIEGFRRDKPVFKYRYRGSRGGLLGSGVISLVAELWRHGLIDHRGRFRRGYRIVDGVKTIVVDREHKVFFTQKDLREFQKAYAAVRSAWRILLDKAGLYIDDLERIVVAGTFGSSIDPRDLIDLELVPADSVDKIIYGGNLVLTGLRIAVMDRDYYMLHGKLLRSIRHINLAEEENYMRVWINSLEFPRRPS